MAGSLLTSLQIAIARVLGHGAVSDVCLVCRVEGARTNGACMEPRVIAKAPPGKGCPRCGGFVYAAEQMLARGKVTITLIVKQPIQESYMLYQLSIKNIFNSSKILIILILMALTKLLLYNCYSPITGDASNA